MPIRKKGKLPAKAIGQEYELEYGIDMIEIHEDALDAGEPVLLVDDLIATGGTAERCGQVAAQARMRKSSARPSSSICRTLAAAPASPSSAIECHTLMAFEGD